MTGRGINVLVVDDEPLIRMALVYALEDEGYGVFEASTVLQAVAVLAKNDIDAVVTDVDMPGGLSGFDLAEMITRLPKAIAIVVTSGRALPSDASLPEEAIFISKPYALGPLVSTLKWLTTSRRITSTA